MRSILPGAPRRRLGGCLAAAACSLGSAIRSRQVEVLANQLRLRVHDVVRSAARQGANESSKKRSKLRTLASWDLLAVHVPALSFHSKSL